MRKFYAAAILLIGIAVLFLVKSLNAPSATLPVAQTPTPSASVALTKDQQKEQIDAMLAKANHCTVREDCTMQSFGCPFGCYNLVNKDEDMTQVSKAVEAYNADGNACVYKCAAPPEPGMILCTAGKCVDARYEPMK